jgi:hypothetical protein
MAGGLLVVALIQPSAALDYEKDIMPIFEAKCADCHSAKAEKVKGGLKFDDPKHFQSRFEKNNVVVPGDWDASYLFITVFRPADAEEAMPPDGKGERLTAEEAKLVQQWINEGAPINGTRGKEGPELPADNDALFAHLPKGEKAEPATETKPAPPVERDWTNREGKAIRATLLRVEDGNALLKLQNGTVYRYPIDKLSDESQAQLKAGAE